TPLPSSVMAEVARKV
ncbi:unnamed protein product, partial [Allacma fusca]